MEEENRQERENGMEEKKTDVRKVKRSYRRKRRIRRWKKRRVINGSVRLFLLFAGVVLLLFAAARGYLKGRVSQEFSSGSGSIQGNAASGAVTIGATGSFILHDAILESAYRSDGTYDFDPIFRFITPVYSSLDFLTCEFEGNLAGEEAEYSGYPSFNSPDEIIRSIKRSGVDLQLVATNHVYDMGSTGFRRTSAVYTRERIPFTGIRAQESDRRYYIADVKGFRIGWIDYTYETEGDGTDLNDITLDEDDAALVNTFDYDDLESFYLDLEGQLAKMREEGAEFLVLNLHWGTEYQLEPSRVQKEIAAKAAEMGVDALIGGHPHCEQPIDVIVDTATGHSMFVIYSVGNALSNQRRDILKQEMPEGNTEDGVLVKLTLSRAQSGEVVITGVDLVPTWVYRSRLDAETGLHRFYILPLSDVNQIEERTGIAGISQDAKDSRIRTMEVLGPGLQKAQEAFAGKES